MQQQELKRKAELERQKMEMELLKSKRNMLQFRV